MKKKDVNLCHEVGLLCLAFRFRMTCVVVPFNIDHGQRNLARKCTTPPFLKMEERNGQYRS